MERPAQLIAARAVGHLPLTPGTPSRILGRPGTQDHMSLMARLVRIVAIALLAAGSAAPAAAHAQLVTVTVVTPDGGPMQGALVTLVDTAGVRRACGFSRARGPVAAAAPGSGRAAISAGHAWRASCAALP